MIATNDEKINKNLGYKTSIYINNLCQNDEIIKEIQTVKEIVHTQNIRLNLLTNRIKKDNNIKFV
jgi:hypothetical protein